MDFITRGLVIRIQRMIEQVEGGNALTNSDIRYLVGNEGLAEYEAGIAHSRRERDIQAKAYPDILDGEVPGYLKALRAAFDATAAALRLKSNPPKGKGKKADDARRKWRETRDRARTLQEAAQEAWEVVDAKYHHMFKLPRPASDPRGPGHDADVGPTYAAFEFPPAIPFTLLEIWRSPDLTNIPLHQQRELLVRELEKLQESDPRPPSENPVVSERVHRLRARASS